MTAGVDVKRVTKNDSRDITDRVLEELSPAALKNIIGDVYHNDFKIFVAWTWSEYGDETPQRGEQSGREGQ